MKKSNIVRFSEEAIKKITFPQFEENQKEQLGCLCDIRRRHLKDITFPHFEENQKKPEGCF